MAESSSFTVLRLTARALSGGKQEAPPLKRTQLSFYGSYPQPAASFAWLSSVGVYHGPLSFASALQHHTSAVTSFSTFPFTPVEGQRLEDNEAIPLFVACSRFHVLLVYPNSLKAVCTLNNLQVAEENFPPKAGNISSVTVDQTAHAIYCVTSHGCVYKINNDNETRDVWRLFLDRQEFADALEFCKTDEQRETVLSAEADMLFEEADYVAAAVKYAKTKISFETISLKFLDAAQDDALRVYLKRKLRMIEKDQLTRIALLATWMVELFLGSLNTLKGPQKRTEYDRVLRDLEDFLSTDTCLKVLHKDTVFDLIQSHGNVDALLFFAAQHSEYQHIIQHYLRMNQFDQVIEVLHEQAREHPNLVYWSAPRVIHVAPTELLALCRSHPELEPQRLIPAFVRYQQHTDPSPTVLKAITEYLEWCIERSSNKSGDAAAVSHYLISLYVTWDDERPLLKFIEKHKLRPPYDPKYVLRLCTEHKRFRACVGIYSSLQMHEEAVAIALQVDLAMAQDVIEQLSGFSIGGDDTTTSDLKRRLWLKIAKHVIEKGHNVEQAMEILKHSNVLKIEDILPFFSDFTKIDAFQEHIKTSLEQYNTEIADLNNKMKATTKSAEMIRSDINALNKRYQLVSGTAKCMLTNYPLLSRPFYVFPCQHAFHKDALIKEVVKHLKPSERREANKLRQALPNLRGTRATEAQARLDELVTQDCPLCGEIAIKMIEQQFVPEDQLPQYIESWSLGNNLIGVESGVSYGMTEAERDAYENDASLDLDDDAGDIDLENFTLD